MRLELSEQERRWAEALREDLKSLKGGKIIATEVYVDDEGAWPVLKVKFPRDPEVYVLEISRDHEGNGPGHIFIGTEGEVATARAEAAAFEAALADNPEAAMAGFRTEQAAKYGGEVKAS